MTRTVMTVRLRSANRQDIRRRIRRARARIFLAGRSTGTALKTVFRHRHMFIFYLRLLIIFAIFSPSSSPPPSSRKSEP